jgi:hypothetical protein
MIFRSRTNMYFVQFEAFVQFRRQVLWQHIQGNIEHVNRVQMVVKAASDFHRYLAFQSNYTYLNIWNRYVLVLNIL